MQEDDLQNTSGVYSGWSLDRAECNGWFGSEDLLIYVDYEAELLKDILHLIQLTNGIN